VLLGVDRSARISREVLKTGSLELFARYPAGHVVPLHWHSANERIVHIEGRMSIEEGATSRFGPAYLPARQTEKMIACHKHAVRSTCSGTALWIFIQRERVNSAVSSPTFCRLTKLEPYRIRGMRGYYA